MTRHAHTLSLTSAEALQVAAGTKTQVRRLVGVEQYPGEWVLDQVSPRTGAARLRRAPGIPVRSQRTSPCGPVGTTIYFREPWRTGTELDHLTDFELRFRFAPVHVVLAADGVVVHDPRFDRPSPRTPSNPGVERDAGSQPVWACRSMATVSSLRVERLQALSEDDAIALGHESRAAFRKHWDAKHPRAAWVDNPWVWAIAWTDRDAQPTRPHGGTSS